VEDVGYILEIENMRNREPATYQSTLTRLLDSRSTAGAESRARHDTTESRTPVTPPVFHE
jgi:hypothetical protein